MLYNEQYTKSQVSVVTGLNVATCNALLNDMEIQVIVTVDNKLLRENWNKVDFI